MRLIGKSFDRDILFYRCFLPSYAIHRYDILFHGDTDVGRCVNVVHQYEEYFLTKISGPYGPFILAPVEGTLVRTQGLASLAGPVKV